MNITIQSLHFTAGPELEEYVEKKVRKLSEFNDRIITGEVTLKIEPTDKQNKICEIRLGIPGNDLFASRQADTFEEATVEVVNILQRQLEKRKSKLTGGRA